MKYTLEDFKNNKIAVWVRNEVEYGQFCIFARGMEWQDGELVHEYTPIFPCEIAVGFRHYDNCTMTFDDIKGFHSQGSPFIYKPVTVDELKISSGK
jgi:hypothetical protein